MRPTTALLTCSLAAFLLVVAMGAIAATAPSWREVLFEEDGVVETGTALAFFLTACIGAWAAVQRVEPVRLLAVVAALAALATLDELSFGERLIGFEAPVVLNTKIDAVHDLFMLAKRLLETNVPAPYLTAGLLLLGGSALGGFLAHRWWRTAGRPALHVGAPHALFALAVLLVGAAQILDLKLRVTPHATLEPFYTEEALELAASLVLLVLVLTAGRSGERTRRWISAVRDGLRAPITRPLPGRAAPPREGASIARGA